MGEKGRKNITPLPLFSISQRGALNGRKEEEEKERGMRLKPRSFPALDDTARAQKEKGKQFNGMVFPLFTIMHIGSTYGFRQSTFTTHRRELSNFCPHTFD